MTPINFVALIFITVGLAFGWLAFSRANLQPADEEKQVRLFGAYSPLLTWLRYRRMPVVKQQVQVRLLEWLRVRVGVLLELGVIAIWVMWVGRAYLDFNPFVWPTGREFGSQIQTHHMWTQVQRCGLCALWNGGINGGYPALADTFGSMLQPTVIIPTLLWGTAIGAKVAVVLSLGMAGLAQWWMARSLGLGRVARLWSAALVVVGGHLAGRLEVGALGLVVSTAACSLALAAALDLGMTGQRRATIRLAILGAVAIVAGQGYMQLALVVWAPAFLVFLLDENLRLRPLWREFALAVGVSVLLAGIFIVPVAHFWPNIAKFIDVDFKAAQPLEYGVLNLVIRDMAYLSGGILEKLPFPYLYTLYIGWVPILLASLCLYFARREHLIPLLCLSVGAGLMFFVASAIPLKWLATLAPDFFTGFRHPPLIAGLAVPAILSLAAYALDRILALKWPQIILRLRLNTAEPTLSFGLAWLLALPLFGSVYTAYNFTQPFFTISNFHSVYSDVEALQMPSLRWVALPFGEHYWVEPALDKGLKISDVVWAWGWKGRNAPAPQLIAGLGDAPPDTKRAGVLGASGIPLYENVIQDYTYVDLGNQRVPCRATGGGGDLTVTCSTGQDGRLIVQENSWVGWYVWRDGQSAPLIESAWLMTDAPQGQHTYRFRYLPWDVALGLTVTLIGCALTVWLWRRSAPASTPSS